MPKKRNTSSTASSFSPIINEVVLHAFHHSLDQWYQREKRDLPWRQDPTPYHVAVSELMCQQTQIATVLPYYDKWMKLFPGWRELAQAHEDIVLKTWEGLGYYRRARMLHALAKSVDSSPSKELPSDVEALRKLPGIGPYTAGAIASIAFGVRASLVDGNVERVLARAFNFKEDISLPSNRRVISRIAERLLPQKNCGDYNQSLMELGARICTPRNPTCMLCPIQKICLAENPESLPIKKREASISEKETLAIIRDGDRLWLSLPESPKRWKGFYRLPNFDPKMMKIEKNLGSHTYTITKYRITADAVLASFKKTQENGKWFSFPELESIFLPAPHRKIIKLIHSNT